MDTQFTLDAPLRAVGEFLAHHDQTAAVVIVGGTALNLLGLVRRATRDVDVIATGVPEGDGPPTSIAPPTPLPPPLADVIARVARDFELAPDWMNTTVGDQWKTGLPPGFERRITWRRYKALWVGLAHRRDLIFLKLYAAADDVGTTSRHFTDLLALSPTHEQLTAAAQWIHTQDPSPAMRELVETVIQHVLEGAR